MTLDVCHVKKSERGFYKDRTGGQRVTYRQKPVRNVMSDVNQETDVCEMEAIAQVNKSERNDVVQDQLIEVFARFLQPQHKHKSLLGPVCSLQEIIQLKLRRENFVRVALVHWSRFEPPHAAHLHHIHTKRPEHGEIDSRVELLIEARNLALVLQIELDSQGS